MESICIKCYLLTVNMKRFSKAFWVRLIAEYCIRDHNLTILIQSKGQNAWDLLLECFDFYKPLQFRDQALRVLEGLFLIFTTPSLVLEECQNNTCQNKIWFSEVNISGRDTNMYTIKFFIEYVVFLNIFRYIWNVRDIKLVN